MKLEDALEKIYAMHQFNIKLGLDNIKNLMEYLGNPEAKLKSIHIAGSNGKGSTASFVSSILQESGYKVGLYTSPHLIKFNERIRINGEMIPDNYIRSFITEINDYIITNKPTFFEITTAMAFKYFAESEIDIAVVETGLGGRLDATNILNPLAAAITTISKEHTNILGNSIEEITFEKAGIIKNGEKVFIGLIPQEAKKIIYGQSLKLNNKIFELEKNVLITKKYIKFVHDDFEIIINNTPLIGDHQLINAALSILIVINTFPNISKQFIENGIQSVVRNTGIQGRYEIISSNPRIIMDGGHNPECVTTFANEFKKEYLNYSNRTLIIGAMNDKNYVSMLKKVNFYFDNIYVVDINYERAFSAEELRMMAEDNNIEVSILKNPVAFIQKFAEENVSINNECLVIMGSIYLLGELKSKLEIYLDNKGILE